MAMEIAEYRAELARHWIDQDLGGKCIQNVAIKPFKDTLVGAGP